MKLANSVWRQRADNCWFDIVNMVKREWSSSCIITHVLAYDPSEFSISIQLNSLGLQHWTPTPSNITPVLFILIYTINMKLEQYNKEIFFNDFTRFQCCFRCISWLRQRQVVSTAASCMYVCVCSTGSSLFHEHVKSALYIYSTLPPLTTHCNLHHIIRPWHAWGTV